MLLNEFLPVYDVHERHEIIVRVPVEQVYATLWDINFGASRLVRGLFFIRTLPLLLRQGPQQAVPDALTLNDFLKRGFILLGKQHNQEILLGVVGRFWALRGNIRRLQPSDFQHFSEAGYAKAAMNFYLVPEAGRKTRLITETRVVCLDEGSQRKFRLYWRCIRLFSGCIRRRMLYAIKRAVEQRQRGADQIPDEVNQR